MVCAVCSAIQGTCKVSEWGYCIFTWTHYDGDICHTWENLAIDDYVNALQFARARAIIYHRHSADDCDLLGNSVFKEKSKCFKIFAGRMR